MINKITAAKEKIKDLAVYIFYKDSAFYGKRYLRGIWELLRVVAIIVSIIVFMVLTVVYTMHFTIQNRIKNNEPINIVCNKGTETESHFEAYYIESNHSEIVYYDRNENRHVIMNTPCSYSGE